MNRTSAGTLFLRLALAVISLQPRALAHPEATQSGGNISSTPAFSLRGANGAALTHGIPKFGHLTASSATPRQIQFGLRIALSEPA
jgi:hypothetical protein